VRQVGRAPHGRTLPLLPLLDSLPRLLQHVTRKCGDHLCE
jgi:hypothetical protein